METKKRVAIWVRVSTDLQAKDDSPEHHELRGRYYAEAKGWEVVKVYRLDALSGKSIVDYPQTKQMLEDIKQGHIEGLIFSKLARFARNTKELLEFADVFRNHNADLISLSENIDTSTPAGRLFYTMIAAMATWEREEIAERVAASVPIRAKMGKPLGGQASYGYKWVGKELAVDETEAPIRKLMYELFLKYKRKKTVANELNKRGYRTRKNALFTDTTVDRLLRDSSAKGQRVANYTRSTGEGKKWVIKPKEDWVITPCQPIVTEELWDACNDLLEKQTRKNTKPGRQAVHLLSGFVYCTCGKKMYVFHEKSATYRCKACKTAIPASDIDDIYYSQLKSFLLTEKTAKDLELQSTKTLQEKEVLLDQTSSQIRELQQKMDEYVELRVNKELTPQEFAAYYNPLKERLAQYKERVPELEAQIDYLRVQFLSADSVLQNARNLYDSWPTLQFEEKRSIVEVITNKLTIGKSDINISLAYIPSPHTPLPSQKRGKRQHQFRGSSKRST
ncbi:MAG: hypothetical protein B7Z54_03370 [Sphingobacteriales bacterium 12-47-4]|nr:MAG: hypothetical protein B7Z54_03370 [Sphingobacteriales bacterium 12-47-4]